MVELVPPLVQAWERPSAPRPIVVIGAGGIVRDAHLPAYRRLGFDVKGLFDLKPERARELADEFGVRRIYRSVEEAVAEPDAVFDVAVPAVAVADVISRLPRGAAVLIQKPMGSDLEDARNILGLCQGLELIAAINFQLRFSPNMLALRDALRRGLLGRVTDVEVRINTHTPWHLWPFLRGIPRHEVLYHSIHYLDLLRALLGEPRGAFAKVVHNPLGELEAYSDTSTSIILDYGSELRVSLTMNHQHRFGAEYARSQLKVEGTDAAVVARMGVNLDYPKGRPDTFSFASANGAWGSMPLRGSWFTEAFEGPMSNLMRFVAGEDAVLESRVADAIKTMAVVEACYQSSASGGTPIPALPPPAAAPKEPSEGTVET
jgi:predicted dehydrogenase